MCCGIGKELYYQIEADSHLNSLILRTAEPIERGLIKHDLPKIILVSFNTSSLQSGLYDRRHIEYLNLQLDQNHKFRTLFENKIQIKTSQCYDLPQTEKLAEDIAFLQRQGIRENYLKVFNELQPENRDLLVRLICRFMGGDYHNLSKTKFINEHEDFRESKGKKKHTVNDIFQLISPFVFISDMSDEQKKNVLNNFGNFLKKNKIEDLNTLTTLILPIIKKMYGRSKIESIISFTQFAAHYSDISELTTMISFITHFLNEDMNDQEKISTISFFTNFSTWEKCRDNLSEGSLEYFPSTLKMMEKWVKSMHLFIKDPSLSNQQKISTTFHFIKFANEHMHLFEELLYVILNMTSPLEAIETLAGLADEAELISTQDMEKKINDLKKTINLPVLHQQLLSHEFMREYRNFFIFKTFQEMMQNENYRSVKNLLKSIDSILIDCDRWHKERCFSDLLKQSILRGFTSIESLSKDLEGKSVEDKGGKLANYGVFFIFISHPTQKEKNQNQTNHSYSFQEEAYPTNPPPPLNPPQSLFKQVFMDHINLSKSPFDNKQDFRKKCKHINDIKEYEDFLYQTFKESDLKFFGLSEDQLSETELKKTYKKTRLKYHPDKNPAKDAPEIFKTIDPIHNRIQCYLKFKQVNMAESVKQQLMFYWENNELPTM